MSDAYVHVVPGVVRRIWCDRCQSSSAVAVNVYAFADDLTPPLVGEFTACPTCEPDEFESGGDDDA